MKVTHLSLWHVPLTSHTAYDRADGKTCDTMETVMITVQTDKGITGGGEVCPIPHYLPAYARGVAPWAGPWHHRRQGKPRHARPDTGLSP